MADKLIKLYYTGNRYMPELSHPRFGKFELHDEGYFEVPREYAERILLNTPAMFSAKASKKKKGAFTGAEYSNMSYGELQDYAKTRNVKAIAVKKSDIVKALVSLDNEKVDAPEPVKEVAEEEAEG